MFLVLPVTLIAIGCCQLWFDTGHPELPLAFSFSNILLLLFLFPMLFVLVEILREGHTLGLLDTTVMAAIFLLLIALLLVYGTQKKQLTGALCAGAVVHGLSKWIEEGTRLRPGRASDEPDCLSNRPRWLIDSASED